MDKTAAREKLRSIGQKHVFVHFDTLTALQQGELIAQVDALNIPTLRQQQQMLVSSPQQTVRLLDPLQEFSTIGNPENIKAGKKLIAEGKVGCLVVAGGQGTRLRFDGPKGIFPVSVIKKKSLFQLLAEKVLAAGKQVGRQLPLAVMTSPQNHERTLHFFEEHQNFGLDREQLTIFCQGMLPLLNPQGNLFLDQPHHIAVGPDGNGSSLKHFVMQGIWEKWYDRGVRFLNFVLIDNPLADPFDAELVGFHHHRGADVVAKCTPRLHSEEKVGILIRHEDKARVIEYSELPEEECTATLEDGSLKHACANLSLFSFSMDFIHGAAKAQMPFHLAKKAVKYLTPEGKTMQAEEPNACKFEAFIFDVLPLALKVQALLYPREQCFAPLKNAQGEASIVTVQAALQYRDREIIKAITGAEPPTHPFELAQEFYYPTEDFLENWKRKPLAEETYIEP